MIQGFLQEGTLGAMTRLVLVNAIHFKGLWRLPFPEAATRQRIFHKLDGSTVAVPMMEQTAEFHYGEEAPPWRDGGWGNFGPESARGSFSEHVQSTGVRMRRARP